MMVPGFTGDLFLTFEIPPVKARRRQAVQRCDWGSWSELQLGRQLKAGSLCGDGSNAPASPPPCFLLLCDVVHKIFIFSKTM